MLTIIVVTILTFFVIYGPQPLLPLLAETYGVSRPQAALLITVTMFPLSLAPITYGYVLEAVPAARLLRLSVLVLGVTTLAFALANLFPLLVGLRFVQGLLLPAVLTSLMTYLSAWGQGRQMQRVMSVYVAATIAGGCCRASAPRFLTGTSFFCCWRWRCWRWCCRWAGCKCRPKFTGPGHRPGCCLMRCATPFTCGYTASSLACSLFLPG